MENGVKKMLESIEMLGDQVQQAWDEAGDILIPKEFGEVDNILVCGMGGSALGADFVKSVFKDELKKPLYILQDYNLPSWVKDKTLVVLSSYSGDTEEVLEVASNIECRVGAFLSSVAPKGAKEEAPTVIGLTKGGELFRWFTKNKKPAYQIRDEYNPSKQPRAGLGYSIFGLARVLKSCDLLEIQDREVALGVDFVNKIVSRGDVAREAGKLAKECSAGLSGLLIVASEFLVGNAHILANQLNETAKQFACYFTIPEMNHHLLEAIGKGGKPRTRSGLVQTLSWACLLLESDLYHPRNQKRYELTKEILEMEGVKSIAYIPQAKEKLLQALEVLVFSSYLSLELAMLKGVDPMNVEVVEGFKKRMV